LYVQTPSIYLLKRTAFEGPGQIVLPLAFFGAIRKSEQAGNNRAVHAFAAFLSAVK
jgi:hypothetical protein